MRAACAALTLALAAVADTARAQPDAPPVAAERDAPRGEPLLLVDLRPGEAADLRVSRAAFAASLRGIEGLAVRGDAAADAGLDDALAGVPSDADGPALDAALAEAQAAFGALDCARATAAAHRAIDLAAARQASNRDVRRPLVTGWSYALLCADQAGDRPPAAQAAERLRGLGVAVAADAALPDAVWGRYPALDAATDREIVAVTVEGPVGAAVWIDHAPRGAAPVTAYLPAGEHVVAAADGARRGAARVSATRGAARVTVEVEDRAGPWSAIAELVGGWRAGTLTPTAEGLTTIMRPLGARFALLLVGAATIQVWALPPGEARAVRLDDASRADVLAIGAMVSDRVVAWDGPGPDAARPLPPGPGDARDAGPPQRWWVYGAILGAVALGTAVLYATDAADDRQRIEVRFP